jgi:hypothetical protein
MYHEIASSFGPSLPCQPTFTVARCQGASAHRHGDRSGAKISGGRGRYSRRIGRSLLPSFPGRYLILFWLHLPRCGPQKFFVSGHRVCFRLAQSTQSLRAEFLRRESSSNSHFVLANAMRLKARSAWPDFSSQEIRPKKSHSVFSESSSYPAGDSGRETPSSVEIFLAPFCRLA